MLHTLRPLLLSLLLLLALGGCGGASREAVPPPQGAQTGPSFSTERAWQELEGLVALGARPAGSEAAAAARRRIRAALAPTGAALEAVEIPGEGDGAEPPVLTHLVATLPGASPDWLVFVAPYDSAPSLPEEAEEALDPRISASGAALLVELVRAFSGREPSFTLRFVWLEGDRLRAGDAAASERRRPGSRGLAGHWRASGDLERVRLLLAFDGVCDTGRPVARDLGSHRWHRDELWRAAQRLGRVDVFSPEGGFESVEASHAAFRAQGVRPVVAITASRESDGVSLPGGEGAEGNPERCTADRLEAVGEVTLEAVGTIAQRLAKIDRFTRQPADPPAGAGTDVEERP